MFDSNQACHVKWWDYISVLDGSCQRNSGSSIAILPVIQSGTTPATTEETTSCLNNDGNARGSSCSRGGSGNSYSCLSGRNKPQSFRWHQNIALLQPWCKIFCKNEPKHGPKNGTAWRSHFWDRIHSLVKAQKKSIFTVPFLGPPDGPKNGTAKSQNQQQRPTRPNKNTSAFTEAKSI